MTFTHGGTARYDLVVGADGLHSGVRRLAFGPEQDFLRFRGHYFAFASIGRGPGQERWMTMFNRPGRMAGVYRSAGRADAKVYFVFRSDPIPYDRHSLGQQLQTVRDAFAADTAAGRWHVDTLLAAAAADPDFYFDAVSQVRLPRWSNGRIVLIGDAAHCASPASGAGAELAVIGAHRLATELEHATGNHEAAFARYQAAHEPLVRRRQRIGANLRMMVPRTEAGRRVRDGLARLPLLTTLGALERRYRDEPMAASDLSRIR